MAESRQLSTPRTPAPRWRRSSWALSPRPQIRVLGALPKLRLRFISVIPKRPGGAALTSRSSSGRSLTTTGGVRRLTVVALLAAGCTDGRAVSASSSDQGGRRTGTRDARLELLALRPDVHWVEGFSLMEGALGAQTTHRTVIRSCDRPPSGLPTWSVTARILGACRSFGRLSWRPPCRLSWPS